jgi:hypothetical protein
MCDSSNEWYKWNPHITSGIYEPPKIGCYYAQLPVSWLNKHDIDIFFGEDRKIFREITRRYRGCLYIWYDSINEIIEFWTKSSYAAILVRNALLNRIELMQKLIQKRKKNS